jgi:hypothetical protein
MEQPELDVRLLAFEDHLKEIHIELILKASGQKVGLAKVKIRSIRVKARSSKSGWEASMGIYLQINSMDMCLDYVQAMKRLPKSGQDKSPYEKLTENETNYLGDSKLNVL